MSQRLDITSRDLNRGQNDSAAAERLEFPGFRRSWNTRGERETARRRFGYMSDSEGASVTYGTKGFSLSNTNYATVTEYGDVSTFATFDFAINGSDIGPATGLKQLIGSTGAGTPGPLNVYFTNQDLTIQVKAAGTATFNYTGIDGTKPLYVRIVCTPTKIVCYVCAYPEQLNTANAGTLATGPLVLCHDYVNTGLTADWGWLRVFGSTFLNRGGISTLFPRPRDKDVYLSLICDYGHQTITDGATTYIPDESSYQRHAPMTGSFSLGSGAQAPVFTQFAGDTTGRGEAGPRFPMIMDGDVVLGEMI